MMTSKNSWCCTPVKYKNNPYLNHRNNNIDTHHHQQSLVNSDEDDIIVQIGQQNIMKKNMSTTTSDETINHCKNYQDANNDTSIHSICHITDTATMPTISRTTSENAVLYYSRYTTARLRASTPNQRSPLFARQLRF